MRQSSLRSWQQWRITTGTSTPMPQADRFRRGTVSPSTPAPSGEEPIVDGIRHELVARIRQQIADGTYDTEEKWLAAEEALFRRMGS